MQILDQRFVVEFWLRLRSASDSGYDFRNDIKGISYPELTLLVGLRWALPTLPIDSIH